MSRAEVIAKRNEQIFALWNSGLTIATIAERVGVTIDAVKWLARSHRDRCPPRDPSKVSRGTLRRAKAPPQPSGAYKRRTIWIVPMSIGNGQTGATAIPVSVRAFSWDEVAA